jgi:soluble P-type ATPase
MRRIAIPGRPTLELGHLVLDVNGTLTNRGVLVESAVAGLRALRGALDLHLVSADTFGSLVGIAATLDLESHVVESGAEKVRYVRELGAERCAAVGNGANDADMLREVALGIAVIGPEGAASAAVAAADVVCRSIEDAFALLLDEAALAATLRR